MKSITNQNSPVPTGLSHLTPPNPAKKVDSTVPISCCQGIFAVGWLELGEAEKAQKLLEKSFDNIQGPFQVGERDDSCTSDTWLSSPFSRIHVHTHPGK